MLLFPGSPRYNSTQSEEIKAHVLQVTYAWSISSACRLTRGTSRALASGFLLCVFATFFATGSTAQTAAQRGQTLFTSTANCSAACHPANSSLNGANAVGVINNAQASGMGGLGPGGVALTAGNISDIAAYLATTITDPFVAPSNVPYSGSLNVVIPTASGTVLRFASTYSRFDRFTAFNGGKGSAAYVSGSTIQYTASDSGTPASAER